MNQRILEVEEEASAQIEILNREKEIL